jgi:hypothetical protein
MQIQTITIVWCPYIGIPYGHISDQFLPSRSQSDRGRLFSKRNLGATLLFLQQGIKVNNNH